MFEDPKRTKRYLKIALQGGAKVGKTLFALSFPDVHVIDGEHGTDPYRERRKFQVKHTNTWKGLGAELKELEEKPAVGATLVIDPITVFYKDLLNDLVELVKKKRGHEVLSQAEWNIASRRWFAFLNMLVRLPMHVILIPREKEEYTETTNSRGEEVRKKTGNFLMECDKQTEYLFDIILRVHTEENKKEKTSKHLFTVLGTRYDWLLKYSTHDVTKKLPYKTFFQKHVEEMLDAPDPEPTPVEPDAEKLVEELPSPVESVSAKTAEGDGRVEELKKKFCDPGANLVRSDDKYGGPAAPDEIKVLMTRVGQVRWPDGSKFTSAQGKQMIKELYDLESTKDLKKFQFEFLYKEFGEVLAGRAHLALEGEVPVIVRESAVSAATK